MNAPTSVRPAIAYTRGASRSFQKHPVRLFETVLAGEHRATQQAAPQYRIGCSVTPCRAIDFIQTVEGLGTSIQFGCGICAVH